MMAMIYKRIREWQEARRASSSRTLDGVRPGEDALVSKLAERLYRNDLKEGGWVADIGNVGPGVYRHEASWIRREVSLGTAQGGPPTP